MDKKTLGIFLLLGAAGYAAYYFYNESKNKKLLEFVKKQVAENEDTLPTSSVTMTA